MKEFIDKLISRLEELCDRNDKMKKESYKEKDWETFELFTYRNEGVYSAIEIVNQLAEEYNNKWIRVKDDLPTENGWYWGYYVTSSYTGTDGVKHTECKYASIYWEDNLWLYDPRSFRTVDEVIAWKPIAPYQPKGE